MEEVEVLDTYITLSRNVFSLPFLLDFFRDVLIGNQLITYRLEGVGRLLVTILLNIDPRLKGLHSHH